MGSILRGVYHWGLMTQAAETSSSLRLQKKIPPRNEFSNTFTKWNHVSNMQKCLRAKICCCCCGCGCCFYTHFFQASGMDARMASTSSCRLALQLRMSSVTGKNGVLFFFHALLQLRIFSTRKISHILVDDLMTGWWLDEKSGFWKKLAGVTFRTLPFIKTWRAQSLFIANKNLAG